MFSSRMFTPRWADGLRSHPGSDARAHHAGLSFFSSSFETHGFEFASRSACGRGFGLVK
jgi:hypothetical protein